MLTCHLSKCVEKYNEEAIFLFIHKNLTSPLFDSRVAALLGFIVYWIGFNPIKLLQ